MRDLQPLELPNPMDPNYQPLSRNVRDEGLQAKTYDQRKKLIEDKYTSEFELIKDNVIN